MGIKFVDELQPNGRTFTIADMKNIRGGLHHAATILEMTQIHESRLEPGILCFVEENNSYYTYNFMTKKWEISSLGGDSPYQCTKAGISDETVSKPLGNMPGMRRDKLEGLSVNEILTRALFEELPPYFKSTNLSITPKALVEVGTTITTNMFTVNNGTYEYGYVDGNIYSGRIIPTSNLTIASGKSTVNFGTNTNVAVIDTMIIEPQLPGDVINNLQTSWGRTLAEYNNDNPNKTVSKPTISANINTKYGNIVGYYELYYNTLTKDTAISLESDVNNNPNVLSNPTGTNFKKIGNISSTGTEFTVGDGTTNSAFIYMYVPTTLKISTVKMHNGLNNQYETVNTARFGKLTNKGYDNNTSQYKKYASGTSNLLYTYNIWYIAKGDTGAEDKVSPSKALLKVTLVNA